MSTSTFITGDNEIHLGNELPTDDHFYHVIAHYELQTVD
jgi:hypothetical protein